MAGNANFRKRKEWERDDLYTQLEDIEKELSHYRLRFEGKVILCNCDDPYESNFFKYFAINFNRLGIKKLICTCYDFSPMAGTQLALFPMGHPYKIEITEVKDGDGEIELADVEWLLKNQPNTCTALKSGDFRSEECVELLKEADVVVTNPPFSLFREYVSQLIEYDKKFIIIGKVEAITYNEIFPLLKSNRLFLGITINGGDRYFRLPPTHPLTEKTVKLEDGVEGVLVKGVVWFTNLQIV